MDMEVLVEWVGKLLGKMFGTQNERQVRRYWKIVREQINPLEPKMMALPDSAFPKLSDDFRARLGTGATLDSILPEAFAACREASRRAAKMRHFDVQLIGGTVLHEGKISEMATGEGKTLVATLPAYLNSLTGKGVHVVTVNDYLARRDTQWMGPIYDLLGVTVGTIQHDESFRYDRAYSPDTSDRMHNLRPCTRQEAYAADITFGTNNEFGFDYLRDNMKFQAEDQVQHGRHAYAIVDEVDSILIDEARTPLIISGPTDDKSELYISVDKIVKDLVPADYELDEKQRSVVLTEDGTEKMERLLESAGLLVGSNLYDYENTLVVHHLNQALRANVMFKRDIDYIVKNGKVIIIDEFTGRMMDGRRWSDGLHQAVEAKEAVTIEPENQTLASITFQNYFRLYPKIGGMTGTAATEAPEFWDIYKLNVVSIPTHVPVKRIDEDDEFYKNQNDKFAAIARSIKEKQELGQPVLVGTVSIEKSELLAEFLQKEGVKHEVLNARYHEQEAHIVAQAGRLGVVTIATNMAGRGTDIQLGGNVEFRIGDELAGMEDGPEKDAEIARITREVAEEKERVIAAGGLFVLGTERHESRRIDNQLRGRSGRQGDPGLSRFYLSLDDDLLRIFGPQTMFARLMNKNLEDGEAIVSPWISKAIETAQKKVEARNYDIRKQVVEYDDVMNDQRKVIYEQRADIMDADAVGDVVVDMRTETVNSIVGEACPPNTYPEQWDVELLRTRLRDVLGLEPPLDAWLQEDAVDPELLVERIEAMATRTIEEKTADLPTESYIQIEKSILLESLDNHWKEHLAMLDALRQVIHLRAYAQKKPIDEYKHEAFQLFERMLAAIREDVTRTLALATFTFQEPEPLPAYQQFPELQQLPDFITHHIDPFTGDDDTADIDAGSGNILSRLPPLQIEQPAMPIGTNVAELPNVSRNAPCPCGSGLKYKHCHGQLA